MNRIYAFLVSILLLLSACGEDYRVSDSQTSQLEQFVFVVPANFSGEPYQTRTPIKTAVYVNAGDDVKFMASYTLDGAFLPMEIASDLYINHIWNIEDDTIISTVFPYTFDSAGIQHGSLRTIDFLGDTLVNNFNIYINTPLQVGLAFPSNGYNLVDPNSKDGVELRWNIEGRDSWELSDCQIFASLHADSVWKNSLKTIDCNKEISLTLDILSNKDWLKKNKISLKDSSITVYWAVVAKNYRLGEFAEIDSSEIFHFSTLFASGDSSKLIIPIHYNGFNPTQKPHTQITLVRAAGDTLAVLKDSLGHTELSTWVLPQTGLQIFAEDKANTEFRSERIVVDVPQRARVLTDTVQFQDSVLPQIAPRRTVLGIDEPLEFYALDLGSGINEKKISIVVDSDTLQQATMLFNAPILSFANPCKKECNLRISLFDNARNPSPDVYWRITPEKDSLYLTGPFIED
ncbi:MAG: hypothetical protein MJY78_00340 [Fibrobacter sp.]|nr:hypothetical protein [Fibrobacter sp.]